MEENNNETPSKKRIMEEGVENKIGTKKIKKFSAKVFRKQLNQDSRHAALNEFLTLIKESKKHDYLLEYLENGGNCLELLHILETDSTISPVLVFELISFILLKISASCPQYQGAAYEACRYLISNYISVINKMISLNSTTPERKACLKLVTAMIAFSSNLAKDVLINVNFQSANVELLTKHTGEKDSVRDHFIRFLTAFLVDGQYPALSVLLEKKGFITSIIKGLQYDSADTLCIVISAMKNFILENPAVSKTAKMKTFNTAVIRDIVNLYNWKGPEKFSAQKKGKNTSTLSTTVDEVDKSKVNECVHDFLLVLCTSHKFGVIFKDRLLGLGKKTQNALMYTVLESLDRPWDHSYASELVIKICGACPDLSRTVWINLKPYLEPRLTEKWLNAMNFAKKLIHELQPSCIQFCVNDLNVFQLFQVVQCLIAPLPIIKTILPENSTFDSKPVKREVMLLLKEILRALQLYLETFYNWLDTQNYQKFKTYLSNYVTKNCPDSLYILNGWDKAEESEEIDSFITHIETVFEILQIYKSISSTLLDAVNSSDIDLLQILGTLEKFYQNHTNIRKLQTTVINIFIDVDNAKFKLDSDLFLHTINLLLKYYYEGNLQVLKVIEKLIKNTGIFEGCSYEINIWINGILHLKQFDNTIGDILLEILRITNENAGVFLDELSNMRSETRKSDDYSHIIHNLIDSEIIASSVVTVKHRNLSPTVLGLLKFLNDKEVTKSMKFYTNFVLMNLLHSQTESETISKVIMKFETVSDTFKQYVSNWQNGELAQLPKSKGRMDIFEKFSKDFLEADLDIFIKNYDLSYYEDLPLNLLDMTIYYLNSLIKNNLYFQQVRNNFEKFIIYLIENNYLNDIIVERILANPVIVSDISFLKINDETVAKLLLNTFKNLSNTDYDVKKYLKIYKEKLLLAVAKILKKPSKYNTINLTEILEIFSLDYLECLKVLSLLSTSFEKINEYFKIIYDILTHSLKQITECYKKDFNLDALSNGIIRDITKYFIILNETQVDVSILSANILEYLKIFPHSIPAVDQNLIKSLIGLNEFHRDNMNLAIFLLENSDDLTVIVQEQLENICSKKGIVLSILNVLVEKDTDEELLKEIYEKFKPTLKKALEKPQKAGQHFLINFEAVTILIDKFMNLEECENFVKKVQKYEVTEIFHVKFLDTIYNKLITSGDINSSKVNNIILTFVHLQVNLFKRLQANDNENSKAEIIAATFNDLLKKIQPKTESLDLSNTCKNDSLKLYFKFCLKFGIGGPPSLLRCLNKLITILAHFLNNEDAKLLMDMLMSHSEFLENVLGDHSVVKLEIWSVFLTLCKNWTGLMERKHVPVLLASYKAMCHECDRIVLILLKMYEKHANQTSFYDFKPFLWDKAAATHYSVRTSIEHSLRRQPKTGDVLDILQEELILSTITHYHLKETLDSSNTTLAQGNNKVYDLTFLFPLFSQLLAHEQQIATYKFTRSGALSLAIIALSSQDEDVRKAACHILSRFYFHLEARQSGKDNLLWVRYVEAVCKGVAALPDFKMNNFSAIYLARMALILTQPNHVMYVPLSQHLGAKASLDFSTVPELYTFLHSSDVNYKEHRHFILKLLRDGLRTEKDFTDFSRSMAFKLFSELYSCSLSDTDTKLLILDVIKSVCKIPLGIKMLCENHSLLAQIFADVRNILNKDKNESTIIDKIISILLDIVQIMTDNNSNFVIWLILKTIYSHESFNSLIKNSKQSFFKILHVIYRTFPKLLSEEICKILVEKTQDSMSQYLLKHDCKYVNRANLELESEYYYLRLLIVDFKMLR